MGVQERLPLGKELSWEKLKEAILSQVRFLPLASSFPTVGPGPPMGILGCLASPKPRAFSLWPLE